MEKKGGWGLPVQTESLKPNFHKKWGIDLTTGHSSSSPTMHHTLPNIKVQQFSIINHGIRILTKIKFIWNVAFFFFHFFFNFTKWCKMFPLITDEKRNNFYVMIWREKKVQIYNQSENSCGNLLTATRMFNLLAVSVLHPSLHWSEPHDWDGFLDYSTNTKQVHHLASAAYSTTL